MINLAATPRYFTGVNLPTKTDWDEPPIAATMGIERHVCGYACSLAMFMVNQQIDDV